MLDKDEQAQIDDLSCVLGESSTNLPDLGVRILKLYERQFKFSKWCREHGYPLCEVCQSPTTRLHTLPDKKKLCPLCFRSNFVASNI